MNYALHESIAWPGDLEGAESPKHLAFLGRVRVLEVGDELGEYCAKVLAGLGADVVRIEPPGGALTRTYGPFSTMSPSGSKFVLLAPQPGQAVDGP